MKNAAYQAGYDAYLMGVPCIACPHTIGGDNWQSWVRGWKDSKIDNR